MHVSLMLLLHAQAMQHMHVLHVCLSKAFPPTQHLLGAAALVAAQLQQQPRPGQRDLAHQPWAQHLAHSLRHGCVCHHPEHDSIGLVTQCLVLSKGWQLGHLQAWVRKLSRGSTPCTARHTTHSRHARRGGDVLRGSMQNSSQVQQTCDSRP
jgi:hypothetical protein